MQIYKLVGSQESIRAFAAAQTHKLTGKDVTDDYAIYLQSKVPPLHDYRAEKFVKRLERWDHHSTREFIQFQLYVEDVSRVLSFWFMNYSQNLSFMQQSQRFVKVDSDKVVGQLKDYVPTFSNAYNKLLKLVPEEDARYALPQGVYTNFVMSGNLQGFYLAIQKLFSNRVPSEFNEFVDSVLNVISSDARMSVEGIIDKLEMGDNELVNYSYDAKEIPASVTLNDIYLDEFLAEDQLRNSVVSFYGVLSTSAAHQLIRHRAMNHEILSIGEGYITPPSIKSNKDATDIFNEVIGMLFDAAKENESQYFLPNAAAVEIYGGENLYNFIANFIPLRTCAAAQWEIRKFAMQLRNQVTNELGFELPIGRCFYYPTKSPLSMSFPTRSCPESNKVKKNCGIYLKNL